jgi:hypothetical protein
MWEERIWSLANGITGFALVQSLVAGYTFGKGEFPEMSRRGAIISLALLTIITVAQIYAVQACYLAATSLPKTDPTAQRLWAMATVGRQIAIGFFALAPFLGIIGKLVGPEAGQ